MSTTIAEPPPQAIAPPSGETRILVPDATWTLYESFVKNLPESTPVRTAFDGRNMEIMVKGPVHDHFARFLDQFIMTVAGSLGIRILFLGETTWIRPELARGIESDNCYYLDPEKIASGLSLIRRRVNDVAGYPNPDLAIEVDISPPQVDRQAIYAAMGVAELWTFDGQDLTIRRLDENGCYQRVDRSGFLRVRADQVPRWLTTEDLSDYGAWTRRLRRWAEEELRGE
jgi:Uma2 family endonuclease